MFSALAIMFTAISIMLAPTFHGLARALRLAGSFIT
jgi:hypothetical protein